MLFVFHPSRGCWLVSCFPRGGLSFIRRVFAHPETHRTVLSLISCFAGGVFLAACLLDIVPDYLSDISAELDARGVEVSPRGSVVGWWSVRLICVCVTQTSFPLPEFIMAAGFFAVLIVERMVLNWREAAGAQDEERAPLFQANRSDHGHGGPAGRDVEGSGHHVHVDFQAHSPFRSFMLFLSLSLHSVFEGLAIGLQDTDSKVKVHFLLRFNLFVTFMI